MPTTIATARVIMPAQRRRRSRAVAVIAAVVAVLVVWFVAVPLLGVQLTVRTAPSSTSTHAVGAGSVLAVSLLVSLLGWGLLAALERRTPRAGTIWTVTAGVVLILSLIGPLTAAVTVGGMVSLVALHLSVAAVLIPVLRRTAAPR